MKIIRIICLVASLLCFSLIGTALADESLFLDVPATHWAYKSIQSLAKAGIVNGFSDKTFRPNLKVTREQFAIVLVRKFKLPLDDRAPQIFSDVKPDYWAFPYIDAAKWFIPTPTNTQGSSYNFNPNKPITREEVAESLVLALDLDKKLKPEARFLANTFTDYQSISPSYKDEVALAVYNKIMSGNADGTFNPKGALTRAELCVLLDKPKSEKSLKLTPVAAPGFTPNEQSKPWTIEFGFERPDYDVIKSFTGMVTAKVYDSGTYLVLENFTVNKTYRDVNTTTKTVAMHVNAADIDWFFVGDLIKVNYDRDNNVTSYLIENEAQPHNYLPPVGGKK